METFFDTSNHPKIKLKISGRRKEHTLEAILDTGFDGHLSLPISVAVSLGLELTSVIPVQYADGRISQELVFSVKVYFGGKEKLVPATLTGGAEALAGTALFTGYKLTFDFIKQKIVLGK